MSSDAKVWFDHESHYGGSWEGVHDGPCENPNAHSGTRYDLTEVLKGVEDCMKVRSLAWEFRIYPDGKCGLVGYESR